MLWVFTSAGLTGILCGCLFRAPVMVVLSVLTFGCAFVISAIEANSPGSAIVVAFLTSAALQLGYLLGIGLQHVSRRIQTRVTSLYRGLDIDSLIAFPKARLRAVGHRGKMRNLAR
jgi:hypothetical protein